MGEAGRERGLSGLCGWGRGKGRAEKDWMAESARARLAR